MDFSVMFSSYNTRSHIWMNEVKNRRTKIKKGKIDGLD